VKPWKKVPRDAKPRTPSPAILNFVEGTDIHAMLRTLVASAPEGSAVDTGPIYMGDFALLLIDHRDRLGQQIMAYLGATGGEGSRSLFLGPRSSVEEMIRGLFGRFSAWPDEPLPVVVFCADQVTLWSSGIPWPNFD
jgi:hypothetical protein